MNSSVSVHMLIVSSELIHSKVLSEQWWKAGNDSHEKQQFFTFTKPVV